MRALPNIADVCGFRSSLQETEMFTQGAKRCCVGHCSTALDDFCGRNQQGQSDVQHGNSNDDDSEPKAKKPRIAH